MPSWSLAELAQTRLSTISAFIALYFIVSGIIYWIWNALRSDFEFLPPLTFPRCLMFIFLWGLAFHLVLSMISGTRELMSPRAWERASVIHKLKPDEFDQIMDARRQRLIELREELWRHADAHGDQLPSEATSEIRTSAWKTVTGQEKYIYLAEQVRGNPPKVIAYEPSSFGQQRMVLFSNGMIELMHIRDIKRFQDTQ